MTISVNRSPVRSDVEETNESKNLFTTREKFEDPLEGEPVNDLRRDFPIDQRGSVNTEIRQHRLRSNLLSYKGSVSNRSSLSRGGKSSFSFHPSINYKSQWKPKYDDHHDQKRMVNRMHKESEKIMAKKRLASEQKKLEEMSKCTFKPKLVSKRLDTSAPVVEPTLKTPVAKPTEPATVDQLSVRLYQYAEDFKFRKQEKKQKIQEERGQEIRFAPKLETEKFNSDLESLSSRKNVYSGLYEDYVRRTQGKKQAKDQEKKGRKVAKHSVNDDLLHTLKAPKQQFQKKRCSLGGDRIKYNNDSLNQPQGFSTSVYHATKTKINLAE